MAAILPHIRIDTKLEAHFMNCFYKRCHSFWKSVRVGLDPLSCRIANAPAVIKQNVIKRYGLQTRLFYVCSDADDLLGRAPVGAALVPRAPSAPSNYRSTRRSNVRRESEAEAN